MDGISAMMATEMVKMVQDRDAQIRRLRGLLESIVRNCEDHRTATSEQARFKLRVVYDACTAALAEMGDPDPDA